MIVLRAPPVNTLPKTPWPKNPDPRDKLISVLTDGGRAEIDDRRTMIKLTVGVNWGDRNETYFPPTSPYARLAMIVSLEKGLSDLVKRVCTRTRSPNDTIHAINQSDSIVHRLPTYCLKERNPLQTGFHEWTSDQGKASPRRLIGNNKSVVFS